MAAGRQDLFSVLTNGQLPLEARLRLAVEGLNELQAVFVLDNFEDVMVLETREIADPELAELYAYLATHVTRGSRVIVTCRYVPVKTPQDQANLLHLPLPDFQEAEFLKFLRRDAKVEKRIRQQAFSAELLTTIFRTLGGTPASMASCATCCARSIPTICSHSCAAKSPVPSWKSAKPTNTSASSSTDCTRRCRSMPGAW